MFPWHVVMDRDGNTTVSRISCDRLPFSADWRDESWPGTVHGRSEWHFKLLATDEQHAAKIANERRAALIATGNWTVDFGEWQRRQIARNDARRSAPL